MKITKIFARFGSRREDQDLPRSEERREIKPFHAVSIVPKSASCALAHELCRERVRFLSKEAPPLPLPKCTQPEHCGCRFQKYADRRLDRRRSFSPSSQRWYAGDERRRLHGGRRITDR